MDGERSLIVDGALMLHGTVGEDLFGEGGFTAREVAGALMHFPADVLVRLNSGGGDAFEGAAIHAALKAHPGRATIRVEGIAASAASTVAMAGDEIVMAEGAVMMIHDPASITIGPASAHRATAEMLEKLAANYAAVYAARSGRPVAEIRAMMEAETWFTAAEAVAAGFADRAETGEAAPTAAFDFRVYARAPESLRALAEDRGWQRAAPEKRAVAAQAKEAPMATQKETAAPGAETAPAAAPVEAKAPAPAADEAAQRAVAMDARRRAVVARVGDKLTAAAVEEIIAQAPDDAAAVMTAVDRVVADKLKEAGPETRVTVTADEGERNVDAMIGGLRNTLFGTPLEGAAMQYRGLTPKRLAMNLAGKGKFGFDDLERVKAGMKARGVVMSGGMHSTSDFTYLTTEAMNRELRAAYEARPGTWRRISRQRTAVDFRTLHSVQAGADVEMRPVKESGEYQSTVLSDTGESFAVARYGREVHLTFEAVINDDLGAFTRLPGDFARGALNLESRIAWGIINANAQMSDGTALFATAAARKNLAAANSAISATSVGLGRKAMWEQRPLGAKATGDDFISAVPNLLAVPPALELVALQFITATTPATDGTTNPFKGTLEPIVEPRLGAAVTGGSDTAWYLFDSSLPVLEHAFLQGYEAPMVEPEENRNPKGITLTAEHIFGAGAVEFRGAFKNIGA